MSRSWSLGIIAAVLSIGLAPGVGRADPGFPRPLDPQPAWENGPDGAFRPLAGGSGGRELFVDANTGDDANDGSQAHPVKTIGRALELAHAGDSVVVAAGVYREQVIVPTLNPSPSRARPLTLRADPPDGESVVIDGTNLVPIKEGSLSYGAGVSLVGDPAVVVDGFRIQNWDGYGMAVSQGSDVVVRRCAFADNGAGMPDSMDLLLIGSRDTRVVENRFLGTAERAIDERANDSWIAYNVFRGYAVNVIHVGPHPAGQGARIEHNRFEDNPASQGAILVDGARGVAVERNLLLRGSLQAIRLDGAQDTRALQNTAVGFAFGIELHTLTGCRVEGNILAQNVVGLEALSYFPDSTIDNNLFFENQVDREGIDPGLGDVSADPRFADPAAGDYTPGPNSPAIDTGPEDVAVPTGGGARADRGALEVGAGDPPWAYQPRAAVSDLTPAWRFQYTDRDPGAVQKAYHVQVDRTPTFDSPALVDSSWQFSAEGRWIVPAAFELSAGVWYMRAKVQDQSNNPSPWSPPSFAATVSPAPACAAQGGTSCQALDDCQGTWVPAADSARCCVGSCVPCPDGDSDGAREASCGGTDCDDADPLVNPNATENCENGKDDNCDGKIDLADKDCGCVDRDRDGYGLHCPDGPDCDDTIASVHPGAEELCNNTDDDCDGATDEGFELKTDPQNCGECGWACRDSNPRQVCDLGQCVASCGGGRTDCSRACIDTQSDLLNCGGCGVRCELPFAGEACREGQCQLTACEAGHVDLDGDPQNGCEYACTASGTETCPNGLDDDCDGETDEDCGGSGCGCGALPAGLDPILLCLALLGLRPRGRFTR